MSFHPIPMKSRTVQDINTEQHTAELMEIFARDIETFFNFLESINFYENLTVNDYSEEREQITIAEWISESKRMLRLGQTTLVSESAIKLIDDICKFTKNRLSKTLVELATRLDKINQIYQDRQSEFDSIKDEIEMLRSTVKQLEHDNETLTREINTYKSLLKESYDTIQAMNDGETLESLQQSKDKQEKIRLIHEARETLAEINEPEQELEEEEQPPEPATATKQNPRPNNKEKNQEQSWVLDKG